MQTNENLQRDNDERAADEAKEIKRVMLQRLQRILEREQAEGRMIGKTVQDLLKQTQQL
jgi:methylthioribose-1-phosphate isomerase